MSQNSKIEWTDATWSPLRVRVKENAAEIAKAKGYTSLIQIAGKMAGHVGPHCERVSHGCDNCYSDTNNGRCLPANGTGLPFDRRARDLVEPFVDDKILAQALRWKKPQRIFVENQSDLFGEWVSDEEIDRVFAVMALCPQHTFQVLTKRPERMLSLLGSHWQFERRVREIAGVHPIAHRLWPLDNVWLGVSVEDQATADDRIGKLIRTPAALRFISYEPALGPVSFRWAKWDDHSPNCRRVKQLPDVQRDGRTLAGCIDHLDGLRMLDWVIVGGESGPGARPIHPDWVRTIRDECRAAGVPFFFKQWGEWIEFRQSGLVTFPPTCRTLEVEQKMVSTQAPRITLCRVGKKAAGAMLDGREWREFPEARA